MYIYHVLSDKLNKDGILVLANSIKDVRAKYAPASVSRWCYPNKKTIELQLFADDLTGTTNKVYSYDK